MQFFFQKEKKVSVELVDHITRACDGLNYISETDAPVNVFDGGPADDINVETIRNVTPSPADANVEEIDFQKFFARLTKNETWHNAEQRVETKKFLELEKLLEENLHDLKVFKIGAIRVSIYAVGLDDDNNIIGVRTEAVQT